MAIENVCTSCNEECADNDDKLFRCLLCSSKFVHFACLGVTENCFTSIGMLSWKCHACSQVTAVEDGKIKKLETKLEILDDLVALVKKLQSDLNTIKSNQLLENNNGVPLSRLNNALNNVNRGRSLSRGSLRSSSRGSSLKRNSDEAAGNDYKKSYAETVGNAFSNHSDRYQGTSSENHRVIGKHNTGVVGNKPVAAECSLSGVARLPPRPPRKHIFVTRCNKDCTVANITSYCSDQDLKPLAVRCVSKRDAPVKSFHCVFRNEHYDKVDNPEIWPKDVTVRQFKLNDEAREWIRNFPRE